MVDAARKVPEVPGLEILEQIGYGNQSTVYRVRRGERIFALKFPHFEIRQGLLQLRREAAILSRAKHPGLVEIFEVNEAQGQPYLIMEYIDGSPLSAALERGPLPETQIIEMAKIVSGALAAVHAQSLVHLDVKPQNILLERSGGFKLIDFGFAAEAKPLDEAQAVGTFLYSAPEQTGALRRPVDSRADLYALGVVIFECATGRPPFNHADLSDLLRMHATLNPPDIRELNPQTSPALSLIAAKLLAKDPDDRYQSAHGLLRDLEAIHDLNQRLLLGAEIVLDRNEGWDLGTPSRFLGRKAELESLLTIWKQARAGSGKVVLVEGEPGVGKTRLINEFLKQVRADCLILRAKGIQGGLIPFASLRQMIEDQVRHIVRLPQEDRRQVESRWAAAAGNSIGLLKKISPAFVQLFPEQESSAPMTEAQEAFFQSAARFFVELAKQYRGAVLFLDDLQWIDESTQHVLKGIASSLDEAPMMILFAARDDSPSAPLVERFISRVAGEKLTRLPVRPLSPDTAAVMISDLLGSNEIERAFVEQIVSRSGGNPFAIEEYVRATLDSGLLRKSWGSWLFDHHGMEQLNLPNDLIQLVIQRSVQLSKPTQKVLGVAAVSGARFRVPVIQKALHGASIDQALVEAVQGRIIERGDEQGEYRFVHDRAREALLAQLPKQDLASIHQELAEGMENLGRQSMEDDFSIARHYAQGLPEKSPRASALANFIAGQRALETFANEEAFQFLEKAFLLSKQFGVEVHPELEETLAQAGFLSERLNLAIEHYEAVLRRETDPFRRATLRTSIIRAHLSCLQFKPATAEWREAFRELGCPTPGPGLRQWLGAFKDLLIGLFLDRTGLGYGALKGEGRRKAELMMELYREGGIIGFFQFGTSLQLQGTFRAFRLAYQLGDGQSSALSIMSLGLFFTILGFGRVGIYFIRKGRAMAERIRDPILVARSHSYESLAAVFLGDRNAVHYLNQTLATFERWLSTEDRSYIAGALGFEYWMRGNTTDLLKLMSRNLELLESIGGRAKSTFSTWAHGAAAIGHALLGDRAEALNCVAKAKETRGDNPYNISTDQAVIIQVSLEQGDLGGPIENAIQTYKSFGINPATAPLFNRYFFVMQAYARLSDCMLDERNCPAQKKQRLRDALRELKKAVNHPLLEAYYLAIRAGMERIMGSPSNALRYLNKAEECCRRFSIPLVEYEIARQRAFVYRAIGEENSALHEARMALRIAGDQGWHPRGKKIRAEFDLRESSQGASSSVGTSMTASVVTSTLHAQRQLDALLKLSLASTRVLDLETQARVALDQIVRILGAERAFLFLALDESGSELALKAGRDAQQNDLAGKIKYSTTVVQQVRSTLKPLVISGTEEGAVIGSESAVALNLRSIMAAPLLIADRFVGVVYLDNRIAKGIFTAEDVTILLALANHIAIALETARATQNELAKREFQKDLEVTRAVQSFLLPKESTYQHEGVRLAAYYQSATQSGGDWWWFQERPEGKLAILVGDVTGHGPGAAMMTAAVASSVETLVYKRELRELPDVFHALNHCLAKLGSDSYGMTLAAVEIDRGKAEFTIWTAGAPHILLMNREGGVKRAILGSTPLGQKEIELATRSFRLNPGDRLFIFTDGVYEFKVKDEGQFGTKRLRELFVETRRMDLISARNFIAERIRGLQESAHPPDDMTFVLVDRE